MIDLSLVLSGKPILIQKDIYFYQPTLQDIAEMSERVYWQALNLWTIKRKDLVSQENDFSKDLSDYDIWIQFIFSGPAFKKALATSVQIFLKKKVEFFDISNTIYVGERESGVILDETLYLVLRDLCNRITPEQNNSEQNEQYKETEQMSERERQMIEKMKLSAKKIEETKSPGKKPEDFLGNKILGLVAVGNYTFEQVYNMTMLQFNMLLKKCVDIQKFEISSMLSPYMSSEDSQNNTFWLE